MTGMISNARGGEPYEKNIHHYAVIRAGIVCCIPRLRKESGSPETGGAARNDAASGPGTRSGPGRAGTRARKTGKEVSSCIR